MDFFNEFVIKNCYKNIFLFFVLILRNVTFVARCLK